MDNFGNWIKLRAKDSKIYAGNANKAVALLQQAGVQFSRVMQDATDLTDLILAKDNDTVNKQFSISAMKERDAEYEDAVARGDMDTAQMLVDKAAADAGYINLFYHGAKKGGGFTEFRDWSYFTENRKYAERYAQSDNEDSLYKTYVKMEKPFDTRNAEELDYDSIILDEGGDLVNGKGRHICHLRSRGRAAGGACTGRHCRAECAGLCPQAGSEGADSFIGGLPMLTDI